MRIAKLILLRVCDKVVSMSVKHRRSMRLEDVSEYKLGLVCID